MYYAGQETTNIQPVTTARKTEVRKAKNRKVRQAHLSRASRKPMNRIGAPQLGIALPWNFTMRPGRGTLEAPARMPSSTNQFKSWTPFGFSSSRRKPGSGRSQGGLGNADESLGLSFNVPKLTSMFTPSESFSPTSMAPPTPASGASSFWDPIEAITNLWNNRPDPVKKIRIRFNAKKAVQTATKLLPPEQVKKAVDYARKLGMDPSYLTQYGEVPITGDMAQYGYQSQAIDWSEYLPWIIGAGAAVLILPMILKGR